MSKGLGRGLSSLIPPKESEFTAQAEVEASAPELKQASSIEIQDIPLTDIAPNPLQPRQHFDEKTLEELTASIEEYGLLEPVVVTPVDGGYQLVAGERRFRAFGKLGKKTIPAIVRSTSELERLELALIENIQRKDLNPIEKATAYASLVDDFGLTQQAAAKKLGVARSTLANTIRLLDLPTEIQVALASEELSEGQAKVLLSLDTEKAQMEMFRQIKSGKAPSVRALSSAVERKTGKKPKRRSMVDHELQQVEDEIESALQTKVRVKKTSGGSFQIVIDMYSAEEFRNVTRKLKKK